jgi:Arc/MetJ-type ribon-helix-helix transcriptional regulator
MPKAIERPIPTSSVARLFDHSAAARAIAEPKAATLSVANPVTAPALIPSPQVEPSAGSRQSVLVKRELVLTPEVDETLNRLVLALRQSTGTRLNASHVVRALLRAMGTMAPAIASQANRLRSLRLPPKARGQEAQREAFERQLADLIAAAIKAN